MQTSSRSKLEVYGTAVFIWLAVFLAGLMKMGFDVFRGTLPGNAVRTIPSARSEF